MRSSVRALVLTVSADGALALGAAPAHAAEIPDLPGYDRLDDLADVATCDGPLGGLLQGLGVNCDPEDNPPFTSVPRERTASS